MHEITTVISEPTRLALVLQQAPQTQTTLKIGQGPSGPRGLPGHAVELSTDPNNMATLPGGKLLVANSQIDPLAYYTLAKS